MSEGVELLRSEVQCDSTAAAIVRDCISNLSHLGWLAGDAMLVASELVTNVVTHTGPDPSKQLEVEVSEAQDAILISVRDRVETPHAPGSAAGGRDTGPGLGLVIVDALARQWGTDRNEGYHVWAELAKHQA